MPTENCESHVYKWQKPASSESALSTARDFIKQEHSVVKDTAFAKICSDGCARLLEGKALYTRAHLFPTKRAFKIKVNMTSGVVESHEDSENRNTKGSRGMGSRD